MTRLKLAEDRLKAKTDKSQKMLVIRISDGKYADMFTDEYIEEHYPGYKQYFTIFIPDNGRGPGFTNGEPYTISEE
ncbi:MAG TPA: hypothetical protein VGD14_14525 [bacterium]